MEKTEEEGYRKGGELRPETHIWARMIECDSKQNLRHHQEDGDGEIGRERDRWDERGETGMNGCDTNKG